MSNTNVPKPRDLPADAMPRWVKLMMEMDDVQGAEKVQFVHKMLAFVDVYLHYILRRPALRAVILNYAQQSLLLSAQLGLHSDVAQQNYGITEAAIREHRFASGHLEMLMRL